MILNYTIAICPCVPTPATELHCEGAPPVNLPPDEAREAAASSTGARTCLSGSRAGSATPHGEAVPWELLKEHFISKQGPGDLLCEGLHGVMRGSAEQGDVTPG